MKVSIYGAGYVGLVTGVCFASIGHSVVFYDTNEEKIQMLQKGQGTLFEPDLDEMLEAALKAGKMEFVSDLDKAISFSNMHLMCVGTPSEKDGEAKLTYLFQAIESLAFYTDESFTVIIKSTVPVGTANRIKKKIEEILLNRGKEFSFHVVSCPEFLAQGSAVQNFLHPDRIVIGTDTHYAFEKVKELYAPVIKSNEEQNLPVIFMSCCSAELTKYASNLFLATKISYVNEISRIAELVGADISDTIYGFVTDKRIGSSMSNPGCGFGGSCFPKDMKALIHQSEMHNHNPLLLKSAFEVNENQKKYFIGKVFSLCDFNVKNKVIAIWGIAFKPNTDDLRESISCELIEALAKADAIVQAYDPAAGINAQAKFGHYANFKSCASKEEAVQQADLLVVMTEWPQFYHLDIDFLKSSMNSLLLVDARHIYDPKILTKTGFSYFSIGKGFIPAEQL